MVTQKKLKPQTVYNILGTYSNNSQYSGQLVLFQVEKNIYISHNLFLQNTGMKNVL